MDEVIRNLLDNNKCNKISITFGNKSESFLIDKDIPNDIFTEILNKLIQEHNFTEKQRTLYKSVNKYFMVYGDTGEQNNKATKQIIKDYKLEENYLVGIYDEEELEDILFPCNQSYDQEVKQKIISITINSLSLEFIEEGEFKFIKAIIEYNAYIDDSLKNLSKIFTHYQELIQKQYDSNDNE